MRLDLTLLPMLAASFMLMFARLGTMIMLLPGLGERGVPVRVRLSGALLITLALLPVWRASYPQVSGSFLPLIATLAGEIAIGFVLGMIARLAMSSLQTAGVVVANQLGLGFVTAVDPTQGGQNATVGNFLSLIGVALVFATDMHHLAIQALSDSYTLFKPGEWPTGGDVSQLVVRTVGGSFAVGIKMAAPFLVFGLLFNLGLGVLSRLMPQMQVFFVGMPITILVGLGLFSLMLTTMMGLYLEHLGAVLRQIAPGG